MIYYSKQEAQEYLVRYHMINTDDNLSKNTGILSVFDRIKSIQLDPLDVVGKNVDLVLQSRVKDYKKSDIDFNLYQDRTIIHGWDKQMCIFRTGDYPFFSYVREERASLELKYIKKYLNIEVDHLVEDVHQLIKEEGPKYSKDLQIGNTIKGYWGTNHKESKLVLDYLFHKGIINITNRNNNHKQYDLTENIIGEVAHEKSNINLQVFAKEYLFRRIQSLGLMSNKSGVHVSGVMIESKAKRTKYLKELVKESRIEEVQIEGIDEIYYKPTEKIELGNITNTISFIAPLDNLIWDRELIYKVFDFYYRWEVYTPKSKREFGYYVLPILYKSKFIGRIEFQNYKPNQPLEIINIWYEDGIKQTKSLELKINQALKRFKNYLG